MPDNVSTPLKGIEDAEAAFKRVEPDALALSEEQFSSVNLDIVGATSIILGVLDRVLPFRERIAKLPEFDIRSVDCLEDRAKAAWYAYVVNLPEPEPKDFQPLFEECKTLRATLLAWAEPLVFAGQFEKTSIDQDQGRVGSQGHPQRRGRPRLALPEQVGHDQEHVRRDRGAARPRRDHRPHRLCHHRSPREPGPLHPDRGSPACPEVLDPGGPLLQPVPAGAPVPPVGQRRREVDPSQPAAEPGPRAARQEETPTDTSTETPVTPAPPAPPAGPVVGGGSDPFVRN
jgi:hypothetical protein